MGTNALASRLRQYAIRSFLLVILLTVVLPATTFADAYGRGSFGKCSYGQCASTVVTTPTHLDVDINLSDNQTIPRTGYTIIVTPLNGAGTSFKEVRIFIDGTLAQTITPDPTGTARWFWDPGTFPGTSVSFEIVDTAGTITKRSFTIRLGTEISDNNGSITQNGSTKPSSGERSHNPFTAFIPTVNVAIGHLYRHLQKIVHNLPAPLIESFPYVLFLILFVNITLL
jgi:hypothetical protein